MTPLYQVHSSSVTSQVTVTSWYPGRLYQVRRWLFFHLFTRNRIPVKSSFQLKLIQSRNLPQQSWAGKKRRKAEKKAWEGVQDRRSRIALEWQDRRLDVTHRQLRRNWAIDGWLSVWAAGLGSTSASKLKDRSRKERPQWAEWPECRAFAE